MFSNLSRLAAVCLIALAAQPALAVQPGQIYDAATQQRVSKADLIAALSEADLVILGEFHDNAEDHRWQARLVEGLNGARGVGGLAFEMFGPEREAAAAETRAAGGSAAELETALGWENWPDFSMYAPIFEAAPEAAVTGGALPRGDLMRLAMNPDASPLASRFGVDQPLPETEQAQREQLQADAHCGVLPPEALPGMVSAQRLRDASFADALLRARAADEGRPAVLITGNGHARLDHGVPRKIRKAALGLRLISVGTVELTAEQRGSRYSELFETTPPFDFVIFTPRPDRGDPCEAFRKRSG